MHQQRLNSILLGLGRLWYAALALARLRFADHESFLPDTYTLTPTPNCVSPIFPLDADEGTHDELRLGN